MTTSSRAAFADLTESAHKSVMAIARLMSGQLKWSPRLPGSLTANIMPSEHRWSVAIETRRLHSLPPVITACAMFENPQVVNIAQSP